jgi:hypothetical protein
VITPTLILPHQGGGEFFRELDAPQLCCGVLYSFLSEFGDVVLTVLPMSLYAIHKVSSEIAEISTRILGIFFSISQGRK